MGNVPAMKVAKIDKKASEARDSKKMANVGAGDIPARTRSKVDSQVSSAGEVAEKKMSKAASSDSMEHRTNCVPVSTVILIYYDTSVHKTTRSKNIKLDSVYLF